jgi:hypothetical protein
LQLKLVANSYFCTKLKEKMSNKEKLLKRFRNKPTDFTWDELNNLLNHFGYVLVKGSKTGGSRSKFVCPGRPPIMLHKPHPAKVLKRYQTEYLLDMLKMEGLL